MTATPAGRETSFGTRSGRRRLTVGAYVDGVLRGDRTVLGQALTLVESNRPEHQEQAQEMLLRLLPHTGNALRLGISGVPGVGKSTFIEALGTKLTSDRQRVAVLAVDPSSSVSGGSILGDKTRMSHLARDPMAFIRPSPSSGSLGGVARKTRESLLVCEAAGFEIVLVETVGVGQSETVVADMVDCYLVLMLAGAGDELQGIKRGILELADLVAINKADGDNASRAERARREYASALHFMRPPVAEWQPKVVAVSSVEGTGLDELWQLVLEHRRVLEACGELQARRRRQLIGWMWSMVQDELMARLRRHPDLAHRLPQLEAEVLDGSLTPTLAARRILEIFSSQ